MCAVEHTHDDVALTRPDKLVVLLSPFGEIQWKSIEGGTGWVGPAWTQIDVEFARRQHLPPDPGYMGATVVNGTDGTLAQMVAACIPEQIVETVESVAVVKHLAATCR